MPPVVKTLFKPLLTKADAALVNCQQLYSLLQAELMTNKIAVSVRGASRHAFGHSVQTNMVHLPRTNTFIAQHAPVGYDLFEVRVDYTIDYLNPETLMTRADFLIELDTIWEDMKNTLPETSKKRDIFTEAQELLVGTYQARELGSIDYLEAGNG